MSVTRNMNAAYEVLLPSEVLALGLALQRVDRGEQPTPNVAAVCVYALARLAGVTELGAVGDAS